MESVNTSTVDVILDKKLENDYSAPANTNNFVAAGEITVSITLNEYRQLIKDNAEASIKYTQAVREKYEAEENLKEANKQIDKLKAENAEITKKFTEAILKNGETK